MNNVNWNRFQTPIVTGTPALGTPAPAHRQEQQTEEKPFAAYLQEQISRSSVEFSKHAATRVMERSIPLNDSSIERLNEGVRLAREKGLDDTLIVVDNTAFVVSAKNGKVITTVGRDELRGNVFTNLDGTVII